MGREAETEAPGTEARPPLQTMSNRSILRCTTAFLRAERRHAESTRTPGRPRRRKSGRTLPELRHKAAVLGLSGSGLRKADLLHRLRNPDDFRVVVGSVYLNVTPRITIGMLRMIKAGLYLELKHPCAANLDEWRERLGVGDSSGATADIDALNAEIVAVCQHLGSVQGPSRAAWGSFNEGWEVAAARIRGGRQWTSPVAKLTEGGLRKRKMRTPVRIKSFLGGAALGAAAGGGSPASADGVGGWGFNFIGSAGSAFTTPGKKAKRSQNRSP